MSAFPAPRFCATLAACIAVYIFGKGANFPREHFGY